MRYCPQCTQPLASAELGGAARLVCPDADCGYVHWNNPVPVVAAVVEHDGEIVLTRSRGWPEGMFGLVAGYLEAGETPETGILREVAEELGLTGQVAAFIGHYAFPEKNQLLLCYHVQAAGELRVGEELAEIRRVAPERLRPWTRGTGPAVRDWLIARGLLTAMS